MAHTTIFTRSHVPQLQARIATNQINCKAHVTVNLCIGDVKEFTHLKVLKRVQPVNCSRPFSVSATTKSCLATRDYSYSYIASYYRVVICIHDFLERLRSCMHGDTIHNSIIMNNDSCPRSCLISIHACMYAWLARSWQVSYSYLATYVLETEWCMVHWEVIEVGMDDLL